MGAFDASRPDIITIRDENNWEPHERVRARTIVRAGDEEWVLNQQVIMQSKQGNRQQRRQSGFQRQDAASVDIKSQLGAINRLWVQKMIVDWTFTAGGKPVEFIQAGRNEKDDKRMAAIMALIDQSYIDFIYNTIMEAQPRQAQPEPETNDEDDGKEEGSPFFENALSSTVGDADKIDPVRASMNSLMNMETESNRNYLTR